MKNKYKLIGITGKARSGKDTIAKYPQARSLTYQPQVCDQITAAVSPEGNIYSAPALY